MNASPDTANDFGSNNGLLLGYAEVDYTPSVGLDMEGNYRGDDYGSRGINDPLYAKANSGRGDVTSR